MIKIGKIKLGAVPRIAVSITDKATNGSIKSLPVDILEIRVDQFKKIEPEYVRDIIANRRKIGAPLILTVRSREEGGQKSIPDGLKLKIFRENIPLVDAVDIELKSPVISEVIRAAKKSKKTVIVSWHNFKLTPGNKILKGILNSAKKKGAGIVKIAVKANKIEDVGRLMKFTMENKADNLITISLGAIGSISRLTFPIAGSLITYARINKPSGLGQISLKKLREHLRMYYPRER